MEETGGDASEMDRDGGETTRDGGEAAEELAACVRRAWSGIRVPLRDGARESSVDTETDIRSVVSMMGPESE